MAKYLDENGLLYFWQKIKTLLAGKEPTFTKNTAFNKNFETTATNIKMNGTQAAGTSNNIARADHVHPKDTSKLGTTGNGSDVTATFTESSTRTNLLSGDKLSVHFAKIMRWYNDFTAVVFTGSYNDLLDTPTNVSEFNNDAEYVDLTSLNTWADTTIPEYGYQTAAQVRTIVTGYGYQTASQVSSAISTAVSGVYKVKGSKATLAELPTTGNVTGDVWNVTATGMNYVWTGTAWDALGSEFNIDNITNAEIDTIMAS